MPVPDWKRVVGVGARGLLLVATVTLAQPTAGGIETIDGPRACEEPLFDDWPIPGDEPQSSCRTFLVDCPSFPEILSRTADMRRTVPNAGVTAGTIIFATGGAGTTWFGDRCVNVNLGRGGCEQVARDEIMAPLLEAGFQVLEFRWPQQNGWMESISNGGDPLNDEAWQGYSALTCRIERLIDFLHGAVHPAGLPYCGLGQSGGAVQLAYTVAHHGAESVWDALFLSGGPAFSDILYGCSEEPPCDLPGSNTLGCFDEDAECTIDQAYGNPHPDCDPDDLVGSVGPCQVDPLPADPDFVSLAEADSLVTLLGDYSHPFAVHFFHGELDPTGAPPQAMKYRRALIDAGTETSCRSIPGIGHTVPFGINDPGARGPRTIRNALLRYCVPDPPPVPPRELDLRCTFDHPDVLP